MEEGGKISIIIPTLNEADGIETVVKSAGDYGDEVIVVDGCSTDGTLELAERAGARVFTDSGAGKGAGIRIGIEKAAHDILVFMDADGSHDVTCIPALTKPIIENEADIVIASRTKGGSDDYGNSFDSLLRLFGNRLATYLINIRFKTQLTDVLNGFRASRKRFLIDLDLDEDGFEIEQEMLIRSLMKGYRATEIASHEFARQWGEKKLKTHMGWKMFYCLIKELVQ